MYYTFVYHVAATKAYPTLCGADFWSKCCCGGQHFHNIYLLGTNKPGHPRWTHPPNTACSVWDLVVFPAQFTFLGFMCHFHFTRLWLDFHLMSRRGRWWCYRQNGCQSTDHSWRPCSIICKGVTPLDFFKWPRENLQLCLWWPKQGFKGIFRCKFNPWSNTLY